MEEFHSDIPPEDLRRSLGNYPCLRIHFDEDDNDKWDKLKLLLKLDDQLSPLHDEELPRIIEIHDGFRLEDYAKRFILADANFRMMGSSDLGHLVFYYHIIMIVDARSFSDGTLLHVDFNRGGNASLSFRYPATHSFIPWSCHFHGSSTLAEINEYLHENFGYIPGW